MDIKEVTHQIGDRVKVLHNIPLGNLIGTVKAIYERPGHDLYEVELDGGGVDKLYAFQMEPLVSPPETDDEIEEFMRAHDAGELPNNQKTMKNEIKYAVFNKTESLAGSVLKDLTTLAVVSLLVYVSQGSKWWTLVTGLMFIFWVVAKIAAFTKSRYKTFKTKAELQEWVDSIDCENAQAMASADTQTQPKEPTL